MQSTGTANVLVGGIFQTESTWPEANWQCHANNCKFFMQTIKISFRLNLCNTCSSQSPKWPQNSWLFQLRPQCSEPGRLWAKANKVACLCMQSITGKKLFKMQRLKIPGFQLGIWKYALLDSFCLVYLKWVFLISLHLDFTSATAHCYNICQLNWPKSNLDREWQME